MRHFSLAQLFVLVTNVLQVCDTDRMRTEAEILTLRLTRIKQLIEVLDAVTGRNAEQQAAFVKLKQEIAAVHESLKIIKT